MQLNRDENGFMPMLKKISVILINYHTLLLPLTSDIQKPQICPCSISIISLKVWPQSTWQGVTGQETYPLISQSVSV